MYVCRPPAMKFFFLLACFVIPFTSSYSLRSSNECPTPTQSGLDECSKPRKPCCYLGTRFDHNGCFLGCYSSCLTDVDPATCNSCADPNIRNCLVKPPGCQIMTHDFMGFNSVHRCFQECSVTC
eukprot:XP_019919244.1 PREDICTED: uncharacterized protein LOC105319404 [Crassostrea gigas]